MTGKDPSLSARRGIRQAACGLALLALVPGCQTRGLPPLAEPAPPPPGCVLADLHDDRFVSVEAWSIPDAEFTIGEPLFLEARVSEAAFLNIFHVSTTCGVTHLLRDVELEPARILEFPDSRSGPQIITGLPAGAEAFYFVASGERIGTLLQPFIIREAAGIANLTLTPEQLYVFLFETRRRTGAGGWGVTTVRAAVTAS